jgi:hypothetical protein
VDFITIKSKERNAWQVEWKQKAKNVSLASCELIKSSVDFYSSSRRWRAEVIKQAYVSKTASRVAFTTERSKESGFTSNMKA